MTGIDVILVREDAGLELAAAFEGIDLLDVVIEPPKQKVAATYDGPPVKEVWMPLKVPFNPDRSTLELVRSCDKCGRQEFKFLGIEESPHEEKVGDRWEMVARRPRKPGMGVILPRSAIGKNDFFDYGNNFHMCTQRAKKYIEANKWTNIEFLEYGEVVDE